MGCRVLLSSVTVSLVWSGLARQSASLPVPQAVVGHKQPFDPVTWIVNNRFLPVVNVRITTAAVASRLAGEARRTDGCTRD
jgi:hypothetical protein